jgi:uncharacterized membrane protein YdjX (TVP38/TMEM64 family)
MDERAEAAPVPVPAPSLARRVARSRGLWLLVGVALAGWLLVEAIGALGGPAGIRERFGLAAGLLLVPVQVVVSVSPLPGELVAAVSVAIYGPWTGAALCWLAWLVAAFVEYALVARAARDLAGPEDLERLPRWLRGLPADRPAFLIVARWLPFGGHLVNATAGARGVPLGRFAWTSACSLVPVSLLFAGVTAGLLGLP